MIPASVADGDSFTHGYSHDLPVGFDEHRITVVGVVSLYDGPTAGRQILNPFEAALQVPIFLDGFESQNTSVWSGTTPCRPHDEPTTRVAGPPGRRDRIGAG